MRGSSTRLDGKYESGKTGMQGGHLPRRDGPAAPVPGGGAHGLDIDLADQQEFAGLPLSESKVIAVDV